MAFLRFEKSQFPSNDKKHFFPLKNTFYAYTMWDDTWTLTNLQNISLNILNDKSKVAKIGRKVPKSMNKTKQLVFPLEITFNEYTI